MRQGYRDERVCDELSRLIMECHSSVCFSSMLLLIEKALSFFRVGWNYIILFEGGNQTPTHLIIDHKLKFIFLTHPHIPKTNIPNMCEGLRGGFFTSTTRNCLGHLALYFIIAVLGFRMNYIVFGQSVSYDLIISGMSPGRLVKRRICQCHLNFQNQLKLVMKMMAHTIRRCLVRKKP